MPPRLGYRKSRFGCTTCKQRHVKCNEARPICAACERLKLRCEYQRSTSPQPETTSPGSHSTSAAIPTNSGSRYWLQDILLFHQYQRHTAPALSFVPAPPQFFTNTVLEIASRHEYMMHLVLALSIIHSNASASPLPSGSIPRIAEATQHFEDGMILSRHHLWSDATRQIDARGSFSSVVILIAWSLPLQRHAMAPSEIEHDILMQEIRTVVALAHNLEARPMFTTSIADAPLSDMQLPARLASYLDWFDYHFSLHADPSAAQDYMSGLASLRQLLRLVLNVTSAQAVGYILQWPLLLSGGFVARLHSSPHQTYSSPDGGAEQFVILALFTQLMDSRLGDWLHGAWGSWFMDKADMVLADTQWQVPFKKTAQCIQESLISSFDWSDR